MKFKQGDRVYIAEGWPFKGMIGTVVKGSLPDEFVPIIVVDLDAEDGIYAGLSYTFRLVEAP